jgi:soluble lytic murein transglycosylase-like protein
MGSANCKLDVARLSALILLVTCLISAASPALASVIEIGPNGAVTTYNGPTQFVGATTTPLAQAVAAPPATPPIRLTSPSFPRQIHPVLAGYLDDAASRHDVDPALVRAVAWEESRFRTDAISPKGAIGLMQLMPSTAAQLRVNPYDPQQNVQGGVAYLRALLTQFKGDVRLALAAYNAGPAAVNRYGGIPPFRETQNYVKAIAARLSLP